MADIEQCDIYLVRKSYRGFHLQKKNTNNLQITLPHDHFPNYGPSPNWDYLV